MEIMGVGINYINLNEQFMNMDVKEKDPVKREFYRGCLYGIIIGSILAFLVYTALIFDYKAQNDISVRVTCYGEECSIPECAIYGAYPNPEICSKILNGLGEN